MCAPHCIQYNNLLYCPLLLLRQLVLRINHEGYPLASEDAFTEENKDFIQDGATGILSVHAYYTVLIMLEHRHAFDTENGQDGGRLVLE